MRMLHGRKRLSGRVWLGMLGTGAGLAIMLLLPAALVHRIDPQPAPLELPLSLQLPLPMQPKEKLAVSERPLFVPLYVTERGAVEEIPLESYVRGVVAAEMPVEFELEALKAQAIAARTYAVRRLESGDATGVPPEGAGALVTDTTAHQAYASEEELRERWGFFAYARHMDKLTRAVNETKGLIVTYDGNPIDAAFFSTSNGFTENSESYWQAELPYLRSVPSPWDERVAPDFERETSFSWNEFYRKLNLSPSKVPPKLSVASRSDSGRVLELRIGGAAYTGREVRERLGLASTDFVWEIGDEGILFKTKGYGHGVGLSQWGAHGMAKEGKSAEEIVLYYYRGTEVERL